MEDLTPYSTLQKKQFSFYCYFLETTFQENNRAVHKLISIRKNLFLDKSTHFSFENTKTNHYHIAINPYPTLTNYTLDNILKINDRNLRPQESVSLKLGDCIEFLGRRYYFQQLSWKDILDRKDYIYPENEFDRLEEQKQHLQKQKFLVEEFEKFGRGLLESYPQVPSFPQIFSFKENKKQYRNFIHMFSSFLINFSISITISYHMIFSFPQDLFSWTLKLRPLLSPNILNFLPIIFVYLGIDLISHCFMKMTLVERI